MLLEKVCVLRRRSREIYKTEEIIKKAETIYLDTYKIYTYWKKKRLGSRLLGKKKLQQNERDFKNQVGNSFEMMEGKSLMKPKAKEGSMISKLCEVLGKFFKHKQDRSCCHIHKFLCSKEQASVCHEGCLFQTPQVSCCSVNSDPDVTCETPWQLVGNFRSRQSKQYICLYFSLL